MSGPNLSVERMNVQPNLFQHQKALDPSLTHCIHSFWFDLCYSCKMEVSNEIQPNDSCLELLEDMKTQDPSVLEEKLTGQENDTSDSGTVDPDRMAKRYRASWIMTAVLIAAETASSGMLSLPSAVQVLGYVPGSILLVYLGAVATYTGYLIHIFCRNHKQVRNYDEAAGVLFGRWGRELVFGGQIIFLICAMSSEIIPGGDAIGALSSQTLCASLSTLIFTAGGIVLSVPRTLRGVSVLSISSLVTLVGSTVICMVGVARQNVTYPGGLLSSGKTLEAFTRPTFYNAIVAATDIIFAYAGHVAFVNFIRELVDPKLFLKALFWAQGFIISLYILVAIYFYSFAGNGTQSPFFGDVANIKVQMAAYGVLLPNLFLAGVIYCNVTAKNILRRFPRRELAYARNKRSWALWLLIMFAL
ncbi:hypothetical protein GpartN1_g7527.t1 [Galdieria partita]|uniref:Amino acid transporter transmembrane domain-containing protein n=1 Tax=Galdieria partita TaxID=83374 RepID=A0A9C7Q692_9RHOD|nr:hypothetical protein GpartN1_g7527.t1 [Galdieria partita]